MSQSKKSGLNAARFHLTLLPAQYSDSREGALAWFRSVGYILTLGWGRWRLCLMVPTRECLWEE